MEGRMADRLTRGISGNGHVTAMACSTTELVETARRKHDLWQVAAAALGRTMTAACMMASQLKDEKARLDIQILGDGELGRILANARPDGSVRGYVENPHVNFEIKSGGGLDVGKAVGRSGTLRVIKDLGLKDPFVGTVELQTGEIGDDLAYYFAASEQIPSAVGLGVLVDPDGSVRAAGGWIVQMMPDAGEEEITAVEEAVKRMPKASSLLAQGETPVQMIRRILPDYQEMETHPLRWKCDCSRKKCEGILRSMRVKDLQEMLEEDRGCEMKCDFCGNVYRFGEEELRAILEEKMKEIRENVEAGMDDRKRTDR